MHNIFIRNICAIIFVGAVGYASSIHVDTLTKACNNDDFKKCEILANVYKSGREVAKDDTKASRLYAKACNGGNADACFSLGIQYYNGDGVKRDPNKADQLYKQACDGGISEACTAVNF